MQDDKGLSESANYSYSGVLCTQQLKIGVFLWCGWVFSLVIRPTKHYLHFLLLGQGKATPVKCSRVSVTAVAQVWSEPGPREHGAGPAPSPTPPAAGAVSGAGRSSHGRSLRPASPPAPFPDTPGQALRRHQHGGAVYAPSAAAALRAGSGGARGRGRGWDGRESGRERAGSAALVPGGKCERPGLRLRRVPGLARRFQPQQQTAASCQAVRNPCACPPFGTHCYPL